MNNLLPLEEKKLVFVKRGLKILLCILFPDKFNDGITRSFNPFLEGSKEKYIFRAETIIIKIKVIYSHTCDYDGCLPFYSGCFCLIIGDM